MLHKYTEKYKHTKKDEVNQAFKCCGGNNSFQTGCPTSGAPAVLDMSSLKLAKVQTQRLDAKKREKTSDPNAAMRNSFPS